MSLLLAHPSSSSSHSYSVFTDARIFFKIRGSSGSCLSAPCSGCGDQPGAAGAARCALTAEGGLASRREMFAPPGAVLGPSPSAGLRGLSGSFSSLAVRVHTPSHGQSFSFPRHSLPRREELCSAARYSQDASWRRGAREVKRIFSRLVALEVVEVYL